MKEAESTKKSLEKLTDIIEEVEISEKEQQKIKAALEWISHESLKKEISEPVKKDNTPVSAENVKILVEQFEISNAEAESVLRDRNDSILEALTFLSQN